MACFKIVERLFFTAVFLFTSNCFAQTQTQYPFQNNSLSFEQRVNDLVSRLTLEEKVAQMSDITFIKSNRQSTGRVIIAE